MTQTYTDKSAKAQFPRVLDAKAERETTRAYDNGKCKDVP